MLARWLFWKWIMPLVVNWEWLRLVVNTLGALGFPGILFDAQLFAAVMLWWRH